MKRIILAAFMVCLCTALSFAQTTTGKIVGTVSAADGAIPGATIVARDNQTGKERTVTASGEGSFEISQLEPGTYTITVSAAGYKTLTTNDLKIDVAREYPLNAQLEVGAVTESVTVTAGAEQINSTNAELSTTISAQQIRELPLNGRNPLSLLNLQAGVNVTSGSINGQRTSSVNYTRDGLNVQDNFIRNGFVSDQPTVDDTSEFTATTANAGAEQGAGSTQVQLITPRGGKDFHGALYEFNRNSKFTANSFLNNADALNRPFLNRNQFGGSISGPAYFPHIGEGGPIFDKDKTFFFFNYEGFRLANQVAIPSLQTLLPAARGGNFTYTDLTGVQRTVNVLNGTNLNLTGTNAATFTAAGGTLVVDPIIQSRILDRLPTSGNGTFTGTNFLQQVNLLRSNPEIRNNFVGRFDADINDRNSFNLVYKRNNIEDARTDVAAGFLADTTVSQSGPTNFFTGSYRATLGNSFSNEIRGGFQYSEPFFLNNGIASDFIIGVPLVNQPENTFQNQGRDTLYRNIQDNAVYSIGNHSLRFGGGIEAYKFTATNLAGTTPTFNITSTANAQTPGLTSTLFTGGISATDLARANSLRFLLGGIVGSGSATFNAQGQTEGFARDRQIRTLNFEIYSGYISDQWRVRPNLTVNLGLRYELYTPLNDPRGLYLEPVVTNFDNPVQDILNPNGVYNFIGTNSGTPGNFFKADKNNFGPNISVAYSPNLGKGFFSRLLPASTVIRGGFRVGFVNDEYVRSADNAALNNAGLTQTVSALRAGAATPSAQLRSSLSGANAGFAPLPSLVTPTALTVPRTYATNNVPAQVGTGGTVSLIDPNLQNQKIYEYNFGIQREIGFKTVFEVRYVGNFSNELVRSIDYNQVRVRESGLLNDFLTAQNNCRLQATSAGLVPAGGNPLYFCTSAAFNPAITGSQQLPFFNQLGALGTAASGANGGVGTVASGSSANLLLYLRNEIPGDYAASILIPNNVANSRNLLLANPNTFVANLTTNGGKLRYNSLQTEIRRRFNAGLALQANYTFQKTLTDIPTSESEQTRVAAFLDNNDMGLDYGRAQYDRTHTFNFNGVYELPFGKGKKFLNGGGAANLIFGGFQFSSIVTLSSGAPLSIVDSSGTLNRGGRSGNQSATSSLSSDEIKKLTGVYKTPNGVFFIDPKVLYATGSNGQRIDLTQALPAGVTITGIRATNTTDQTPYDGQVFFFNRAGSTGNLPRYFINGPKYINWDAGLSKNIRFSETTRLQLRGEVFNVINRANFFPFNNNGINNLNNFTDFGRIRLLSNQARIVQFGARLDF